MSKAPVKAAEKGPSKSAVKLNRAQPSMSAIRQAILNFVPAGYCSGCSNCTTATDG